MNEKSIGRAIPFTQWRQPDPPSGLVWQRAASETVFAVAALAEAFYPAQAKGEVWSYEAEVSYAGHGEARYIFAVRML